MVSRNYGELLFRVEVPAGTRLYTQNTRFRGCTFSEKSLQRLKAAGCPDSPDRFVSQGASGRCLPLLRSVFRALNLRGYVNPFGTVNPRGCDSQDLAYVWLDLSGLPESSFVTFGDDKGFPAADPRRSEAEEINALWKDAFSSDKWNLPTSAETLRKAKSHIVGCESFIEKKKTARNSPAAASFLLEACSRPESSPAGDELKAASQIVEHLNQGF